MGPMNGTAKICKNCLVTFIPYKKSHLYCSRKCYLRHYRQIKIDLANQLPTYICWQCQKLFKLTFVPSEKNLSEWNDLICIFCGAKRVDDPIYMRIWWWLTITT